MFSIISADIANSTPGVSPASSQRYSGSWSVSPSFTTFGHFARSPKLKIGNPVRNKLPSAFSCLLLLLCVFPVVHSGEPIEDAFVNSGISITGGALEPASALLDPILQSQIGASLQFNLLEIRELDDPQMQNDDAISVASVLGVDVDGDETNNFSGNNLFEVTPESCLLYTSPSPRDGLLSRMPSSA